MASLTVAVRAGCVFLVAGALMLLSACEGDVPSFQLALVRASDGDVEVATGCVPNVLRIEVEDQSLRERVVYALSPARSGNVLSNITHLDAGTRATGQFSGPLVGPITVRVFVGTDGDGTSIGYRTFAGVPSPGRALAVPATGGADNAEYPADDVFSALGACPTETSAVG